MLTDPNNDCVDTSAGTSFGDTAMYSCNTRYMLSGPAERTCQANGLWNGRPNCDGNWIIYLYMGTDSPIACSCPRQTTVHALNGKGPRVKRMLPYNFPQQYLTCSFVCAKK